ncbi:hypothetical protein BC829DRAFT_381430, partial [Chytridium lagenaria]
MRLAEKNIGKICFRAIYLGVLILNSNPPELKKFEKNSFGDLLWVMRSPLEATSDGRQTSELWTSGDLGLRPVAAFVQSNGDTMKFGRWMEVTAAMSSRDGLINSLESGNAEAFEQSLEEFRKHSSAVATHKESIKIKMRQRQIDSNKERVLLSKLDDMERIPSLIRREVERVHKAIIRYLSAMPITFLPDFN